MTPEEALGRIARAKENMIMAQKSLKELWADWMERRQVDNLSGTQAGVIGMETPERLLDKMVERLDLALTDIKTVRDNLKAKSQ